MEKKTWSHTAIMLGLALSMGCGSNPEPPKPKPSKPPASASPSASPSPSSTPTPEVDYTPGDNGPSVRQSLSEYDVLKRKGMDLTLGKAYEKAIPLLADAAEQNPDDAEVQFYLLLAKGNLEERPSVRSESYMHARNVIELAPKSNEASRAMDYIAAAESEAKLTGEVIPALPDAVSTSPSPSKSASPSPSGSPASKEPYPPTKEPVLEEKEIFVVKPGQQVQLPEAIRSFESMTAQLGPDLQKRIWQAEVYPKAVEVRELPKGLKVKLQGSEIYVYNIASWKGPITYQMDSVKREIVYDANTYRVGAVQLLLELKDGSEAKVWFVNHLERMQPDGNWKVLIGNRLQLERGIPTK